MLCGLLVRSEVVMMRLLVCSNPVVKVVMMLKSARAARSWRTKQFEKKEF